MRIHPQHAFPVVPRVPSRQLDPPTSDQTVIGSRSVQSASTVQPIQSASTVQPIQSASTVQPIQSASTVQPIQSESMVEDAHRSLHFPHTLYRTLGCIHMLVGVLLTSSGCYDVTLFLHPEWCVRQCTMFVNDTVKFDWAPWPHQYNWIIPLTPVFVGLVVISGGCLGTSTCISECSSQRCARKCLMMSSCISGLLLAPSVAVLFCVRASHVMKSGAHISHLVIPCVQIGLLVTITLLCMVTITICCHVTRADPQNPALDDLLLLLYDIDDDFYENYIGPHLFINKMGEKSGNIELMFCQEVVEFQIRLLLGRPNLTTSPHNHSQEASILNWNCQE